MSVQGEGVRGSIIWLKLLPKIGNEQAAYRAAIVLSDGFIRSFSNSKLAFIVPITTKVKNTPFEVPAPTGSDAIPLDGELAEHPEISVLEGVALPDHVKSVDLHARDAVVIGRINPTSPFYTRVADYVKAILA